MTYNNTDIQKLVCDVLQEVVNISVKDSINDVLNVIANTHISSFSLGTKFKTQLRDDLIETIKNRYAKYLD